MTDDNIRVNIAAELLKAGKDLESARRTAEIGELGAAVNRLYYAVYHAALAVCLSAGLEPRSHRGVTHLLRLHFVDKTLLPAWVEPAFSMLQTTRDLADYEPTYEVTPAKYQTARDEAAKLFAELEGFLRSRGFVR